MVKKITTLMIDNNTIESAPLGAGLKNFILKTNQLILDKIFPSSFGIMFDGVDLLQIKTKEVAISFLLPWITRKGMWMKPWSESSGWSAIVPNCDRDDLHTYLLGRKFSPSLAQHDNLVVVPSESKDLGCRFKFA